MYIEMADERRLVLIVTPFNVDRLEHVSAVLNSDEGVEESLTHGTMAVPHMERARGARGRLEFVPLRESIGKVSMTEIAVYPPGVPVVKSGDILSLEAVEYIESNISRIVGLLDGDTIAVREI